MKKILIYIELAIFFTLLSFVFFGAEVSASTTIEPNFNSYKYKWSHESKFQEDVGRQWFQAHKIDKVDGYFAPLNAYFAPVTVRTNSSTNFYQWTNLIAFRTSTSVQKNCEKGTCEISGTIFALEEDYTKAEFDYLKGLKVYYGASNPYNTVEESLQYGYFPCDITLHDSNFYYYSCNVPVNASSNGYNHVLIELENKPFIDISSSSNYETKSFQIGVQSQVNYTCKPMSTPRFEVTRVNNDIQVDILNPTDFDADTVFSYSIYNSKDDIVEHTWLKETTHTFENLSNDLYKITVEATNKKLETSGYYTKYVEITNSSVPIADAVITDKNQNITVDLSGSYSPLMIDITKYYFKLEEGEWIESDSHIHTFENVEYGPRSIFYKVQDANGNFSHEYMKEYNLLTAEEKREQAILGFINDVKDFFFNFGNGITKFFDDFWKYWSSQMDLLITNLLDGTKRLFVPSEGYMENWLNNMMQEFESQLGFLSYPVTWTITVLNRYLTLTDTGSYVISWQSIKVPNFNFNIIEAGSYDLATLLSNSSIKRMHDIYIMSLNALTLLAFFALCYKTYNDLIGISSEKMSYLEVSNGYEVNDLTGEVTSSMTTKKKDSFIKKKRSRL